PFAIDLILRLTNKTQRDLRSIAVQSLAAEVAAFVLNRHYRSTFGLDFNHVAAIDPQMPMPDSIRAAFVNSHCLHPDYSATNLRSVSSVADYVRLRESSIHHGNQVKRRGARAV